ncbi:MAG: hypothetical protein ACLR2O_08910 [Coprococcus sp.]
MEWNPRFLPSSAIGGLIGILLLFTVAVGYIYHMTGNVISSGGLELLGIVAGVVTLSGKIQPVREPFNQLSVRSGVDGCIFRNRGQQYSGCESGIVLYLSLKSMIFSS